MIVRRIHVRQFRKLTDQVLECGPGLNVIRGPNDAGKSTLHRAFWAALFPVKPSEAQSFGPWGEERPGEIVLDFEADGRLYRLRKDFRTRRTTLDVDGQVREGKAVEAEIGRILGLSSPKLFRATVHIGQWELAAVQEEKEEIGPRLAQIVSGGDRDATRVLRQLNSDLTHLEVGLRRPAATPGPLRRAADDVARLVAERDRLQREVDAVERAAAERDRLAARCADLERQVADDDALLEANRQLLELDRRCEELGRRAGELQSLLERVDAAAREVEAAEGAEDLRIPLPDDRVVATLHDALLRVERLRGELSQAEEALHLALAARAPTSVPGLRWSCWPGPPRPWRGASRSSSRAARGGRARGSLGSAASWPSWEGTSGGRSGPRRRSGKRTPGRRWTNAAAPSRRPSGRPARCWPISGSPPRPNSRSASRGPGPHGTASRRPGRSSRPSWRAGPGRRSRRNTGRSPWLSQPPGRRGTPRTWPSAVSTRPGSTASSRTRSAAAGSWTHPGRRSARWSSSSTGGPPRRSSPAWRRPSRRPRSATPGSSAARPSCG